jgi:hypothetical protein
MHAINKTNLPPNGLDTYLYLFSLSTLLSKEVSTMASRTLEAGVNLHVRGTQSLQLDPRPARRRDAEMPGSI